ncbi:MAG TPA: hypothetical protein VFG14_11415, partial [Chthoniobacteraceae bacterium]|nr:hypothetical protein [Chthoniobacteraceae bacterium]
MTFRYILAVFLPAFVSVSLVAGAEPPAALLEAAKQRMDPQPWKVEGIVQGEDGCKIDGIILGQDFDLTVQDREGTSRQIVIGEKSWMSTDQGKSWKQSASPDRRYYFLVRAPIRFKAGDKVPPFESVGKLREGDEELLHVRFKAPDPVAYEGDRPNHWLILEEGKPSGIRRYAGPLVLNNDYVTAQVRYASIDDAKPILPPPGNPSAVPQIDPAVSALNQSLDAMQSGLWEVEATISGAKSVAVRGLMEGKNFDLVTESKDGGEPVRQIAIGDEAWMSKDGGRSWRSADADDRLAYRWVHSPVLPSRTLPPFELVGKEKRGADNVLHLRLKVAEKLGSEKERPHYWLGLNSKDEAYSVRRYEGDLVMSGNQVLRCEADYRPAPAAAAITRPAKDLIKAPAAATLPAPFGKKPLGFFAIDAQKAKIDGKIIQVNITGKV